MSYTSVNILDYTFQAYGDLRSNQYHCVEMAASNVVQICSATTAVMCGVLQNNPNSGESAVVRLIGISKAKTAEALYQGWAVGTAANGALDPKTIGTDTTHYVIGNVLENASSGDIGMVLIDGTPVRGA